MLTQRQIECLSRVRQGKSSNDIAVVLGLSSRTVDEHIAAACEELDVRIRTHAEAIARGLLDEASKSPRILAGPHPGAVSSS